MPRLITYDTYKSYAKKYDIQLTKNNKKKTMDELQTEIYKYETKNKSSIKSKMLYYYKPGHKNDSLYKH